MQTINNNNIIYDMCDESAYLCTQKNGRAHIDTNPVTYRKLLSIASSCAGRLDIDIDEETQEFINSNDELYIRWNIGIDAERRAETCYIVIAENEDEAIKKINDDDDDNVYRIVIPADYEIAEAREK